MDGSFDRDGFLVIPAIFRADEVDAMIAALDDVFARAQDGVLRSSQAIFGARNLLQLWPAVADVWRKPVLVELMTQILGPGAGIVRGLYFDKPPEQSWTLPLHQDMTIAVRDNRTPGPSYLHPTTKAGVPHVEAPFEILRRMATLRIHLDPMTPDNGPLTLVPGSHLGETNRDAVTPLGPAGDVLVMRPLVSHGSRHTKPGTQLRRRIVHLEFAADAELTEGMAWHDFVPIGERHALRA